MSTATYKPEVLRVSGTLTRADAESRTVQFVISDNTRDRHGTVIPVNAWRLDNYNKNGIVAYMHDTGGSLFSSNDPDLILGPGRAFVDEGKLIGEVTFETEDINPLAEKIFKKVMNGTLKATSVGFHEHAGDWGKRAEEQDENTYYFKDVELVEFSIVNIPSNPNALKRSWDGFMDKKKEEKTEKQKTEKKLNKAKWLRKQRAILDIINLKF